MFRFLQGLPRALRSTIQAGYNTHHRSPAATHPSNHPDDSDKQTALSTLLPIVFSNHSISRLHTEAGGKNEHDGQNDWRSFKKHHHWQSFNGHNNFEAVGLGTAIIISLQLCRGLSIFTHPESDNKKSDGPKHMLTSIAYAMPLLDKTTVNGVQMRVLDEEKCRDAKPKYTARQYDSAQNLETSEELEEAFHKLQSVSDESVGMVHNTLGLEEAKKGNRNTAAEHFLKGSEMGYCKAKFNMAVCYEQGRGVDQDLNKAIALYEQAAGHSHAMAQYNLGVLHLQGRGNAQFDSNKAMELITAAASQGLTQAQSYLGAYYLKAPNHDASKAVELLKQAANKQDKEALYHLGVCYQYGLGIECNTAKAASYYHKSASKGYMPAVYCLGTFYEQGLGGLPENIQHAKELYEYASQGGNQEAKTRLKQLHEAETQRQLQKAQKPSKSRLILKRNQSQTKISKPIHASASEPSLSTTATKTVAEESKQMAAIVKHLSYLALFMPYYNMGNFEAPDGESDNIPVRFQVGGGPDESEIAGLGQVSEPLNSGLSVLSVS